MALKDAPTTELGGPGIRGDKGWLDTWETTPELVWPHSTYVYDRMRIDGHLAGCLRAITLPLRRADWYLEADPEVRPEVAEFVRTELGLDDAGRQRRRRQGIRWGEFLQHALLELPFGHMFFEQVYEIADGVAHLRKLAPRMPRTIIEFKIARDGGLDSIVQTIPDDRGFWHEVRIPMDRLVAFVNDREGSNWAGTSVLRPAYPHWLIKQQLMRIDAMSGERNGMGIPWVEYDQAAGGNERTALDIARNVRAGEEAGVATPVGAYRFSLVGLTGSIRDILASIKYHDQEGARLLLAMFLDLGHDNGARSLGDTFLDFFVLAEQAVGDQVAEVTTEHVIRDLVEINYGPDEPYPLLKCAEITGDGAPTAEALYQLARGGYITPDPGIEAVLRKRYDFPALAGDGGGRTVEIDGPGGDEVVVDTATLSQLEERLDRLRRGPRAVR